MTEKRHKNTFGIFWGTVIFGTDAPSACLLGYNSVM